MKSSNNSHRVVSGKYNVIALGARDYYQVAIALHEKLLLNYLITDLFYWKSYGKLKSARFTDQLARKSVISLVPFFLLQRILRRKNKLTNILNRYLVDFLFGFISAFITKCTTNRAVVYSYYLQGFMCYYKLTNAKPESLIVFQVHPTPQFQNLILQDDLNAFKSLSPTFKSSEDMEATYSLNDFNKYLCCLDEADLIFCASAFTAKSINYYRNMSDKIAVVPYGSKFESDTSPSGGNKDNKNFYSKGKIRLLTVGQLVQRKGIHWAFLAMQKLEHIDNYEWLVVSNSIDPSIKALAPKNVRFVSGLNEADLSCVYQQADLFVLPSLVEGFGLVYIEALSHGLPIIYTSNTGADDFCTNNLHGFRVRPSDIKSIFDLFVYLSDKRLMLLRMKQGSKCVSSSVTWINFRKNVADKIISIE